MTRWTCDGCGGTFPDSHGCADDLPDHCDDCWDKHHKKEAKKMNELDLKREGASALLEALKHAGAIDLRRLERERLVCADLDCKLCFWRMAGLTSPDEEDDGS